MLKCDFVLEAALTVQAMCLKRIKKRQKPNVKEQSSKFQKFYAIIILLPSTRQEKKQKPLN